MAFTLFHTAQSKADIAALEQDRALEKRCKAVQKALGLLQTNPRHPGLNTHKYSSLQGPDGEEVFEVYAENNTPAAWRIFWYYGSDRGDITLLAITPHP